MTHVSQVQYSVLTNILSHFQMYLSLGRNTTCPLVIIKPTAIRRDWLHMVDFMDVTNLNMNFAQPGSYGCEETNEDLFSDT